MFLRKIQAATLAFVLAASNIASVFATPTQGPDFNVKFTSAGDATYNNSLTNVNKANTDVTFQLVEESDGGAEQYAFNLPSGFTYQSSNTTSSTCAINLISTTNGRFEFSSSSAGTCLIILTAVYRITASASNGNTNISLLSKNGANWSESSNVTLGITGNNTITRARSLDRNADGYLDGYLLSLSGNSSLAGVTVAGVTTGATTASGSDSILPFTDGVWNTGDLPQIGGTFDGVSLTNTSVSEEDNAKPILLKINTSLISSVGTGQSIQINSSGFDLTFSEKMNPGSASAFSLTKNSAPVAGTFSLNAALDKISFVPSSSLTSGSYTVNATSTAADWSTNQNALTMSIPTLSISDTTAPTGSALGSGTGILINAGNLATNNASVQLQLLATDGVGVIDMQVSNASNFSGATWETYAINKYNWSLDTTSGTGTKTVYARFRDAAGNISTAYSDTITYDPNPSYINFNPNSSIYTNGTSLTLSGSCNDITSTGAVIDTSIDVIRNGITLGTTTCTSNRWIANFTGLNASASNTLSVRYTIDTSLIASLTVINPVPNCGSVSNGTVSGSYPSCSFSCNAGYTKIGGACVSNACNASTPTVNGHAYSVAALIGGATSTVTTSAIGITGGTITYNQTFACTGGNTVTSGSETTNTPSCNNGYSVSGASCVPNSGGGGGGGGGGGLSSPSKDYCPLGDYSGNFYDNRCGTAPTGSTGSTTGGSIIPTLPTTGITIDKLNTVIFPDITSAIGYLKQNISTPAVQKLVDSYGAKLDTPDLTYYRSFDANLNASYNYTLNAYVIMFLRIQDALGGNRSDKVKSDFKTVYPIVTNGIPLVQNVLDRYVVRASHGTTIVYQTRVSAIEKPILALESKVLGKFDTLLSSETITNDEYKTAIDAYNTFVLNLSIYRTYGKNPEAKARAIKAIGIFSAIYAKKVIQKSEPAIDASLEAQRQAYLNALAQNEGKLIGDVYNFSRDLNYGQTNDDIKNLQTVLKAFGYFGTLNPTGFFGSSTKTYLASFSKSVLKIDNPNGLFNAKIRGAINKLRMP